MGLLKKYIFNKRALKQLNSHQRNKRFVSYNKARNILLLFESDKVESNSYIKSVISELTRDGKKVTARGYVDKKLSQTIVTPSFHILSKKDINWIGRPSHELLQEIERTEFDILLNLNTSETIPLQYITLHAEAAMKVGVEQELKQLLDFQIKITPDKSNSETELIDENSSKNPSVFTNELEAEQQYLYEQIIFYLKNIETND